MTSNTYTVQRLDLDFNVTLEKRIFDKETAEELAEYLFLQGHQSRVLDDSGRTICEFEQ